MKWDVGYADGFLYIKKNLVLEEHTEEQHKVHSKILKGRLFNEERGTRKQVFDGKYAAFNRIYVI